MLIKTKEFYRLEDLSFPGIKLYFWGIVIYIIILVIRLQIANNFLTITLRKVEVLSRTLELTIWTEKQESLMKP